MAAGKGKGKGKGVPAIGGVGLARAAGVASTDIEESAEDERHLRKVNINITVFLKIEKLIRIKRFNITKIQC